MGLVQSLGRLFPRPGPVLTVVSLLLIAVVWVSCGAAVGACVGAGGSILTQPVCKDGWTESECSDWNSQGVDGATWSFHANDTCSGLGY